LARTSIGTSGSTRKIRAAFEDRSVIGCFDTGCDSQVPRRGFVRGTGFLPVDLIHIPDGLNAELKTYLLENGSKIVPGSHRLS
jgi:hypothetical protein